jgi:hypothetical protein
VYSLDPIEFIGLREQEQIDLVMSLVELPAPVDRVETITGEQWPARAGERADEYLLRLIADEQSGKTLGEIYVLRRDAGREADSKVKALDDTRRQLLDLGGPVKPEERLSGDDLLGELQALDGQAQARREAETAVQAASDAVQRGQQTYDALLVERDGLARTIEALRKQLNEVEFLLAQDEWEETNGVWTNQLWDADEVEVEVRVQGLAWSYVINQEVLEQGEGADALLALLSSEAAGLEDRD